MYRSEELREIIDNKTKPLGSLGRLEDLALKIALIQQTKSPRFINPTVLIFGSDHGIANEAVSKYPQEVTRQMMLNFANGGAAISVFCKLYDLKLMLIDAGVNGDFSDNPEIINSKIRLGSRNFKYEAAMTLAETELAIAKGAMIAKRVIEEGCNLLMPGEMGIGNSSSAALIISRVLKLPLNECIGRGTGLSDEEYQQKISILKECDLFHKNDFTPKDILKTFGGYEIAMIVGVYLEAFRSKVLAVVDGFITTAAYVIAKAIEPNLDNHTVFSHVSAEGPHRMICDHLKVKPILDLSLRLGEGTGAALSYPILNAAVAFMSDMASFQEAKVSVSN